MFIAVITAGASIGLAAPGDISTFAGGGVGDGGPATAALVRYPGIIALDAAGNMYISDQGTHTVRRVETNGIITTIAGNGIRGYSGDGGLAISASLYNPWDIATDSAGNIYIADSANSRIRKVDTNGIITTIAGNGTFGYAGDGGPAISASLNNPAGIAVDAFDNIIIADKDNNRIRKVDTNGIITTIAGSGLILYGGDGGLATSARIYQPTDVVVDSTGVIYIADHQNQRIRKVDTNGIITTVAGGGICCSYSDGVPATSVFIGMPLGIGLDSQGNLYIATQVPTGANYVRKVDTNGIITTFAGNGTSTYSGDGGPATSAGLLYTAGVATDSSGNIYISHQSAIRVVDAAGIIRTFAGNGACCYIGDGGVASEASLYYPIDVVTDSAGNHYIVDRSNYRVRKIDTNGIITTIAGNGLQGYSGDGGPAISASISPRAVAVDSAGNVYIAEGAPNHRVRKVDTNGIITTFAGNGSWAHSGDGGPATSAGVDDPVGIAVDAVGNVYISEFSHGRIRKVDLNGIITTVAGGGTILGDGGPALAAGLSYPVGLTIDSAGNIFIADNGNGRIRKVDTNGIITTVAGKGLQGYAGDGGPATLASLKYPNDVAIDSAGNIYIADRDNQRVRKVDINGIITSIAGNGLQGYGGDGGPATLTSLFKPQGVAADSAGNIYIADGDIYLADSYNNRIRKVASMLSFLSVSKAGTGSGTITSNPGGVDCGADCTGAYDNGTTVTLTATPNVGSIFDGWSGDADCGDGIVTMDSGRTCTAPLETDSFGSCSAERYVTGSDFFNNDIMFIDFMSLEVIYLLQFEAESMLFVTSTLLDGAPNL